MTTSSVASAGTGSAPSIRSRHRLGDAAGGHHLVARHVAGEFGDVVVGRLQHQVGAGADLDDAAFAHDGDAVGEPQRLEEIVRDEDDRLLEQGLQPQELVLHLPADQRIERAERLVEEPDVGLDREAAGDADALLHAAGKLARAARLAAAEADQLDHLARPPLALRPRHALDAQRIGDVVEHVQMRQQAEILEHHAHLVAAQLDELLFRELRADPGRRSGPRPAVGSTSRDRQRTTVDLPEPDRPMIDEDLAALDRRSSRRRRPARDRVARKRVDRRRDLSARPPGARVTPPLRSGP